MEVRMGNMTQAERQTKGRGRARGRARRQQAENNSVRPGLDKVTISSKADVQVTCSQQPSALGENGAKLPERSEDAGSSPAVEISADERPAEAGPGPQVAHSRRSRFDSPLMSIINKHLGQAQGERYSGQSRSEERAPNPASGNGDDKSHLRSRGLRLKIPGHEAGTGNTEGGAEVHAGERQRSVTFPPPLGYHDGDTTKRRPAPEHSSKGRSGHLDLPPEPVYKGMHDDRTATPHHGIGRGRGRGRARGRGLPTDHDSADHCAGSSISSKQHPTQHVLESEEQFSDAAHMVAGEDDKTQKMVQIYTTQVEEDEWGNETGGSSSRRAKSEPKVLSPVSNSRCKGNQAQVVSSTVADTDGLSLQTSDAVRVPPRTSNGNKEGKSKHDHGGSPSSHGSEKSGKISPLTVHIPDSPNHTPKKKSVSPSGHMNSCEQLATLTTPTKNKEDEDSGVSPGMLTTPPDHVKVLDWAAEVASPTSPGCAPDWAMPSGSSG